MSHFLNILNLQHPSHSLTQVALTAYPKCSDFFCHQKCGILEYYSKCGIDVWKNAWNISLKENVEKISNTFFWIKHLKVIRGVLLLFCIFHTSLKQLK